MRNISVFSVIITIYFIINFKIDYLNGASLNSIGTDFNYFKTLMQRRTRQTTVDECIPPTIPNGNIKVLKQKSFPKKNFLSINVTCVNNYILQPSTDYLMSCFNGFWDVDETPQCKRCIERSDANETTNPELICPEILKENTIFTGDCGQRIDKTHQPFVVNGTLSKFADFPWHVGIYIKDEKHPYPVYHCGGSIISDRFVLTVAHCLSDPYGKNIKKREYFVAAGKYHRSFNADHATIQRRKAVRIDLHSRFKGELTNYAWDIAVVTVNEPFQMSILVHPVCIDWKTNFENEHLSQDTYGEVAGWGKTEFVFNSAASELHVLKVPYIRAEQCNRLVPSSFIRYITPDKFCAGYTNGSSVCDGDSGGGLVFERQEEGRTKYYIRGLVSVGLQNNGMCDEYKYSTYTKISTYIPFIRECVQNKNITITPYSEFNTTISLSPESTENPTDQNIDCKTPNNEEATCISIYDCKNFVYALQYFPTPDVVNFMKNSICGKPDEKKICCGSSVNYLSVIYSNPVTTKPIEDSKLNLLPKPGVCGRRTEVSSQDQQQSHERSSVELLDYPWMALLEYGTPENSAGFLCNGLLINQRYVLTAAHCVGRTRTFDKGRVFRVRLGEYDLHYEFDCVNTTAGTGLLPNGRNCTDLPLNVNVEKIVIHPLYLSRRSKDIALLRLARNISYTDFIKPICLPLNGEKSLSGKQMTTSGWDINEIVFSNRTLKEKSLLYAVSDEDCAKIINDGIRQISYSEVCAKYENGSDGCREIFDGPMMSTLTDSEDIYVEGIISYNVGRCGTFPILIGAKVSKHMDWILSVIQP